MTLKNTKICIIIETKGLGNLALSFSSVVVYQCPSKGREFPPHHFHPEFKHEKMKKANTNCSIKYIFLGQELQHNCSQNYQTSCRKDCTAVPAEAVPPCQLTISELSGMVRQSRSYRDRLLMQSV